MVGGREDDVNVDATFGSVAVVFEFEAVVVLGVDVGGVVGFGGFEGGKAEGGTFEVDECLEGCCRVVCL